MNNKRCGNKFKIIRRLTCMIPKTNIKNIVSAYPNIVFAEKMF